MLSIKHDTIADLLLLNTVTLNKYSIQIRNLPDLDIKHNIDAGKDLTCFVRLVSRLDVFLIIRDIMNVFGDLYIDIY